MPDLWTDEETEILIRAKKEDILSVPRIQV